MKLPVPRSARNHKSITMKEMAEADEKWVAGVKNYILEISANFETLLIKILENLNPSRSF